MKKENTFCFMAMQVLFLSAWLGMSGCSTTKPKMETEETVLPAVTTAPIVEERVSLGDSDSGKALELETIHFEYDSSTLTSVNKNILEKNGSFLKKNPQIKIQIEGHCDARGSIQYNIALGERRADMTREYLENLGISADRVAIVSFGKEKPIDLGTSDAAYAKNRRANFVITMH